MSDYVVYVHQNKKNGKRYIGITNNPSKRWGCKGKNYKGCPRFYAAIQKYGWDGFTHEIIERGLTLDEANHRERYYIARYDTTGDSGYNITEGGNFAPTMLGRHHTEEAKEKMRAKALGRTISEEQKRKLSERKRGRYTGSENPRSTAVRCINTGEVFESQRIAAKAKGVSQPKISRCCNGELNHVHGLKWEFVDTVEA